ncbi:hypothetical protein [Planctomicrobium sp. SH664]|uniref:hypothetical protein n=1 Tax=Planctomicrobium sp. SH664 TaxID=3448125 RepID=UPI003F5C4FA8
MVSTTLQCRLSLPRPVDTSVFSIPPEEMELPIATPANSRVLIIRQTEPTWVPKSHTNLPSRYSVGMPLDLATSLAAELNRRCMADPSRPDTWHIVVYRHAPGFTVIQVKKSSLWVPESEYDLPPDASDPIRNSDARRCVREFNLREMQLAPSPQFWALHVKPLKREESAPLELPVNEPGLRLLRVPGHNDVQFIVKAPGRDREALRKVRAAVDAVTD